MNGRLVIPVVLIPLLVLAQVGCAAPPLSPTGIRVDPALPDEVEAALETCIEPRLAGAAWTRTACEHACRVEGQHGSQGMDCCAYFVQDEIRVAIDPEQDSARITGTVVCRLPRGKSFERLVIYASARGEKVEGGSLQSHLGRAVIRPDAVDPVPLFEEFRIPFELDLREGFPLPGADGKRRVNLLGIVTSEHGPAVAGFLTFSF